MENVFGVFGNKATDYQIWTLLVYNKQFQYLQVQQHNCQLMNNQFLRFRTRRKILDKLQIHLQPLLWWVRGRWQVRANLDIIIFRIILPPRPRFKGLRKRIWFLLLEEHKTLKLHCLRIISESRLLKLSKRIARKFLHLIVLFVAISPIVRGLRNLNLKENLEDFLNPKMLQFIDLLMLLMILENLKLSLTIFSLDESPKY